MKVLIDSKLQRTKPRNSVKVILPRDQWDIETHINITHEGIIIDKIDPHSGDVLSIYNSTYDELSSS